MFMPRTQEVTKMTTHVGADPDRALQGRETPQQVLKSIVDGINTGNLDALILMNGGTPA